MHDIKSQYINKLLYIYHTKKEMHSRDIAVLIDLMLFTTPACFSTLFWFTFVPTLVENF